LLLEKVTTSAFEFEKFEPVNNYYKSLKNALIAYRKIERSGGLPLIDTLKKEHTFEDSIAFYKNLRNYFLLTQDWMPSVESLDTNDTLKNSIANFQERMGLGVSGMLDEETVDALNTPINDRIFQMMINLERLRWIPEHIPESYLLVNIPEFKLHVFEQNKINFSMNVVVGKSATVTTIFNGNLSTIVFSPYWNVPQSIIAREMLPKIKKDPNYLKKNNMEVVKNNVVVNSRNINWHLYSKGVPFTIREKPGKHNSLGLIKFLFPNSYSIYMHDTPSKGLFEHRSRDFSHGCIRLSEPLKLATYLLKSDTSITQEKIIKWMNGGVEKYIKVKPAMPVFIVYFTSWVNNKGQLNFRKDIYGLDKKLAAELFDEGLD
jgi:murein L,D-transpeptidase YcbB/YkuD